MVTSSTATCTLPSATDQLWLNFPLIGHAVVTINATGEVISYNEGARLLFGFHPDGGDVHAADIFGPPVGTRDGVRTLLDSFNTDPGRPPAWTGHLTCFRGPVRPFVVTATAARDLTGSEDSGALTVICGPPPQRNSGLPVAAWLPPDLARRIGHELRGSMTGIAGLAAIMTKRVSSEAREELRRLALIEHNARTAITLVDRVVELSQLESGRIHCRKEPADPRHIIAAAIGMCAATAGFTTRVQDVTTADDLVAYTDPAVARQIITELIDNALVAGAATDVRVHATAQQDSIIIEVLDNGRGITPEERPTIFEPFVRGRSAADGAVGLGLYLARRRAQLIGAELSAPIGPEFGSTFTLELPADPEHPPAAVALAPHAGAGK